MLKMIEKPRPSPAERAWSALSRSVHAALTLIDAAVTMPFRWSENRRIMLTLSAMSDHDLRDIGLTRHDLRDSLALSHGRNTGAFLAGRRSARRRRK